MKGKPIIALTGFMGVGKSSAGAELAKLARGSFIDLDKEIEKAGGERIEDIFQEKGEKFFRSLEYETLRKIFGESLESKNFKAGGAKNGNFEDDNLESGSGAETQKTLVVALGGGSVLNRKVRALLAEQALTVYLKAKASTLAENIRLTGTTKRPLLKDIERGDVDKMCERISSLLAEREEAYMEVADIVVVTDGLDMEAIARATFEKLQIDKGRAALA